TSGVARYARRWPTVPRAAVSPSITTNVVAPCRRYISGSARAPTRSKNNALTPLSRTVIAAIDTDGSETTRATRRPSPARTRRARATRLAPLEATCCLVDLHRRRDALEIEVADLAESGGLERDHGDGVLADEHLTRPGLGGDPGGDIDRAAEGIPLVADP